jgi:hypothetical protein
MREQDSRSYPVREDMRFQYAFWRWERAVWVVMAIILVLALSGLFARGALSRVTVSGPGQRLALTYERFQRASAVSRLSARISAPGADQVSLRLSPLFHEEFQIADIEPRPLRSSAGPHGLELVFPPPAAGELAVVIWATPRSFGVFRLSAAADPEPPVPFSILVYP